MYQLSGTKGFANKYPLEGYALDGKELGDDVKPNHEKLSAHSFVPADVKKALMEKYKHPIVAPTSHLFLFMKKTINFTPLYFLAMKKIEQV